MMWWWPDKPPGKGRAVGRPGDEGVKPEGETRKKNARKSGQRAAMKAAVTLVRTAAKAMASPEATAPTAATDQVDTRQVDGEAEKCSVRPDDASGDGPAQHQ